jgi:hypothetical protein
MGAATVIHDAGFEVYEAGDADEAICMLELQRLIPLTQVALDVVS